MELMAILLLASFAFLFSLGALALCVETYIKLRIFTESTTQIPFKMEQPGMDIDKMVNELSDATDPYAKPRKATDPDNEELSWHQSLMRNKKATSLSDEDPEDLV